MEVFEVADAKTRDAKILSNSDLVPYFYGNFTSFFFTKVNVKLQSYKFLSNLS